MDPWTRVRAASPLPSPPLACGYAFVRSARGRRGRFSWCDTVFGAARGFDERLAASACVLCGGGGFEAVEKSERVRGFCPGVYEGWFGRRGLVWISCRRLMLVLRGRRAFGAGFGERGSEFTSFFGFFRFCFGMRDLFAMV